MTDQIDATVLIDMALEEAFPCKPDGTPPRIELVLNQVAGYVDGYQLAKQSLPARIVVNDVDLKHCMRRIASRMQKPHRDKAKAEWQARRDKGSKQRWRDARPPALTLQGVTWRGIPIESVGYTRHRTVDKN
jgi:hypothetical protein